MYGFDNDTSPNVTYIKTVIVDGGFIRAHYNSKIEIHRYTFISNMAYLSGGAITLWNAMMTVRDNARSMLCIESNRATDVSGFICSRNATIGTHQYDFIH